MAKEFDSLGEMIVPDDVYYGIQTTRALQNSGIQWVRNNEFPKYLWSIAAIKKAAALANREIGVLDEKISNAICSAAEEVMSGEFDSQFLLGFLQGGGVTPINMNVNEVIAKRANEIITGEKSYSIIHPNTHVNMGQSTNDVIPSAISITLFFYLQELIKKIECLEETLVMKVNEFSDVVKIGRTCYQDAVPLTLGQEFSGYLSFLRRQKRKIEALTIECKEIIIGATAVGTGLGIYPGYIKAVYKHLEDITNVSFCQTDNLFDGMQSCDLFISVSSEITNLAIGLARIAHNLILLSSGPRTGLREIELPALQPGSSIMPGKINPVMPEFVIQVAYQVRGNNHIILSAVENGEPDINVWETIIAKCIFESCQLLTMSIPMFADKCLKGIKANKEICRKYAESSISLSVVISTIYGYEIGSKVAKTALRENKTIKEVAVEMKLLTIEDANELLDPMLLTDGEKYAAVLRSRSIIG